MKYISEVRKRLTKKQRSKLQHAHRQESLARYADRIKTILLLASGWPIRKISEALLLDPKTIKRYDSLYKEGGIELLCSDNYTGRECSLSEAELDELKSELRRKIYLSTAEIISFVKTTFGIEYTERDLIFRIGTILRPRSVYSVALAQPDTNILKPSKIGLCEAKSRLKRYWQWFVRPSQPEKQTRKTILVSVYPT